MKENNIRTIAFYLPQYHPIPENDQWWGSGFTEWTNVKKAKPLFDGHYQPHAPSILGYYDLRDEEVRNVQAEMAKNYGIYGFCYYHYWFNGKRLLEKPINSILSSGKPFFPFCLCWANENWTRRWDGHDSEILIAQNHDNQDDLNFIRSLIPFFEDPRYIRINSKPLLVIYRTELFPNIMETSDLWRTEMIKSGIGDLFLIRVESFTEGIDPKTIGFDAALEFAPDWRRMGDRIDSLQRQGIEITYPDLLVFDYNVMIENMLIKPVPNYPLLRCVTPSWDNTPRKGEKGTVFINSNPDKYQAWLRQIVQLTKENLESNHRIIFINAWNEWGEGCHLEPDKRFGLSYLISTKTALKKRSLIEHLRSYRLALLFKKVTESKKEFFLFPFRLIYFIVPGRLKIKLNKLRETFNKINKFYG